MKKDKKNILNKRQRLSPRLYDFSYIYCRSHLKTLQKFLKLLYQTVAKPSILDVGCGSKPLQSLFPEGQYIGVDADSESAADFILDCNSDDFPFGNCSIDAVILSNSLEHIYDTSHLLAEIRRVLKPGGLIFFSVPMMFPVHAHPDDYHRFTLYYFERTFKDWNILQLNGTNSVFSTPIFLVAQLFDTFFPVWLSFLPIIILNLGILCLDHITNILFRITNVEILMTVWLSGPVEVEGILRKKDSNIDVSP